jgi:hypothetical protein
MSTMEQTGEGQPGVHEYAGGTYGVAEHGLSEWSVVDLADDRPLGVVSEILSGVYAIKVADEDEFREETIADWELALDTLIDLNAENSL